MEITSILGAGMKSVAPYKIYIIIGALLALMVGEFFFVKDIYVTAGQVEIAKLKNEQLEAISKNKDRIRSTETTLAAAKLELENENVANKRKISEIHTYYTNLVKRDGLRDPGRKTACDSVPGNPGANGGDQGSGENARLSEEASGFLLELTREADEMKADYTTCYKWKTRASEALKNFNNQAKP